MLHIPFSGPRAPALFVLLLVPLMGRDSRAQNGDFATAWKSLCAEYHAALRESGTVGSSLMFLHEGKVIAQEFHGHADRDTDRLVDADTIYHWASCTKTLTAIAIMQLVHRGKVRLADPILRYVPELANVHNPHGKMEDITLRHLLSHSAGFRSATWPFGGEKPWHPHEPTQWSQLVAMMPYTEILFPPGSRFSYSNPGIVFLGRVIEQISGDDYEVYVDKNILKPLGMTRTYFDTTPYHLLRHRSNNYSWRGDQTVANGLDFDTGITVSNGGLNAPLTDFALYLRFLMGDSELSEVHEGVLPRKLLESMWEPVVPLGPEGSNDSMGLTFFLLERQGRRYVSHTGGQKAFITFFYVDPKTKTSALGAFNTTPKPSPRRASPPGVVTKTLFDKIFPLFR